MLKRYANVVLPIYNEEIDKTFTYKVPKSMRSHVKIGMRAIVPFGKNNRRYEAYIISFSDEVVISENKIKSIFFLPDKNPILENDILQLIFWMKDKYYTTIAECIKCVLPSGIGIKSNFIYRNIDLKENKILTKIEKELYNYVSDKNDFVSEKELLDIFGDGIKKNLNLMVKKNFLIRDQRSSQNDFIKRIKYIFLKNIKINFELVKNKKQKEILKFLIKNGNLPYEYVKNNLNISDSPICSLVKKGLLEIKYIEKKRNPINIKPYDNNEKKIFTYEQIYAINFIMNKYKNKNKKPILIHGVTGSGKTEIYMKLIEKVLKDGKEAIFLVPEISLTPQVIECFISKFGNKVTVTHSKLSKGERYDQWRNAKEGNISIMIGARSAIFTPFRNLGIIILDEEHESSYRSDTSPKYDTREVAYMRSILSDAIVILGSATPSIETFYSVEKQKIELVTLKERVNKKLPKVNIVDMRLELRNGNTSIFSEILKKNIEQNIFNNEQTILFLNRRGHSTFISCRKCGYIMSCDQCSINYTYHIYSDKLSCHYCGKEEKKPINCPNCGSKYIKYFGVGTQKIEEEIKNIFPRIRILRMDLDTTTKKNSHEFILNQFKNRKADILIGTQMIAKGLDFPNVTLVGIIAADISLNYGDYRSAEITFQLLTQVSGRAGRSKKNGRVFIQTYNPNHYSIIYSKDNNYKEFYNHEISLRRQLFYPPYSNIFIILFTCLYEKELVSKLFKLEYIMRYYNKNYNFDIIGPSPAIISKIKNNYRWKIIVKHENEEKVKNFSIYCLNKLKKIENMSNITISLNLNPKINI